MHVSWLAAAEALRQARTPFVLATVVAREAPQSARVGAHAIVHGDGRIEGWIGGGCVRPTVVREAHAALEDGRPRLVRLNPAADPDPRTDVRVFPLTCQGEGAVDIYLEPVLPAPVLVVLGGTPVGQSLARLAPEVGLEVTMLDPTELPADHVGLAQLKERVEQALAGAPERYVVVATMGEADEEALEAAVGAADGAYVGLVASGKKGESLLAYLRARGVPSERTASVKAPAGLDLGATTPGEIALTILAEIVQARRGGARPAAAPGPHAPRALPLVQATPAPPVPAEQPASAGTPPTAPAFATEEAGVGDSAAPTSPAGTATDPVCGMTVDPATARHRYTLPDGRTIYFCCAHCRTAFEKDPQQYLATTAG